jgi:hypothetical protein
MDWSHVFKSVREVGATIKQKRAELERLRREREEVAAAPTALVDLQRRLHALIDQRGAAFPKQLERALGFARKRPFEEASATKWDDTHLLPNGGASGARFSLAGAPAGERALGFFELESLLCAMAGPALKQAVNEALERTLAGQPQGLPMRERVERLAELDQRIATLEQEIESFEQQAGAAGVTLR